MIKLFIGSFFAVLVLGLGVLPTELATDPVHMYAVAFTYIIPSAEIALSVAGIFFIISQLNINVTNAYAGSIARGNLFSRLTHNHPGRVVWLVFNAIIALMLMELGLYQAVENILIIYASLVVAWVGSVVADLVINKSLDSRCDNQCRPEAHLSTRLSEMFGRFLPAYAGQLVHSVTGHFLGIFIITTTITAGLLSVVFYAQQNKTVTELFLISGVLWQVFFLLILVTGVLVCLYVLAQKSASIALNELQLQTELLSSEANAHRVTAVELSQARDVANAANLAKSRYLSNVSHELRTPLNTIFGYAQLMEADVNFDSKCQKIATVIKRSSEHLSDVIEGLLEISNIEARKLNLQRDTVDLKSLMQQLEDMFRPLAQAKGIKVKTNIQTSLPRFVTTDEKRLRQILLNLLSNAIKFTPEGEVEIEIFYRNQVARFYVRDTGIGIAEKDHARIFSPFERVRNSKTQLIKGTGLGLSISHLLSLIMGGNLELKSQLGVGTEFCLSIYLPTVNKLLNNKQNHTDILGYVGRAQHIMVVDDEYNHRNLIDQFLNPLGFVIHQAQSAEQALDIFAKQNIDLFLLDLNMPAMNGRQLLTTLRNDGFSGPVILLSANAYEETLLEHEVMEFQAFISKPVYVNKLLEQIQRCLNLEWKKAGPTLDSTLEINASEDVSQLDIDKLSSLHNFAKMGYLKGVIEYIESLEFQNQLSPVVKQLRLLADECNLEGIIHITEELIGKGEIK